MYCYKHLSTLFFRHPSTCHSYNAIICLQKISQKKIFKQLLYNNKKEREVRNIFAQYEWRHLHLEKAWPEWPRQSLWQRKSNRSCRGSSAAPAAAGTRLSSPCPRPHYRINQSQHLVFSNFSRSLCYSNNHRSWECTVNFGLVSSTVDPDLFVFEPPGSGSGTISQSHGSGSFSHQAKIVKNLDSYCFFTSFLLFIFEK